MEQTRRRERRKDRHVTRLARESIGHAGTPTKVGEAIGRSRSAVCHYATDREHPLLRDTFALLLRMREHPEVDAGAFVQAVASTVELEDIVHAEDSVLIDRGCYLMGAEDLTCMEEDRAALAGPRAHAKALRKHARVAAELADIIDELLFRGIDLHAENRSRGES